MFDASASNQKFIIIMGGKHKSLTISFLLQKCGISATLQKPKIWYYANDLVDYFHIHLLFWRSSLVLRQRSGRLFFVIHSLFPSRQLSLAPPRESQPYLQNESCFEFLRSSTHSLIDPISVVGYVRVDARQLCASTSDPPRHQPDQRAFTILQQE